MDIKIYQGLFEDFLADLFYDWTNKELGDAAENIRETVSQIHVLETNSEVVIAMSESTRLLSKLKNLKRLGADLHESGNALTKYLLQVSTGQDPDPELLDALNCEAEG